jgi:hypothetical protein
MEKLMKNVTVSSAKEVAHFIKSQKTDVFATYENLDEVIKQFNLNQEQIVVSMIIVNTLLENIADKIVKQTQIEEDARNGKA